MKTICCSLVFFLLIFFNHSAVVSGKETPPKESSVNYDFIPPDGKVLLIVGQDRATIAKYVSATNEIPAGVMLYTSVQTVDGLEDGADYGAGVQHGKALLTAYPNSVIQIGLYLVDALDGIISGTYDRNLQFLARWIKKADRPVYLRIGYEFDLPDNKYYPEKYRAAFHHIVNLLRQMNVRNVAFVWHSCIPDKPQRPWMDWYPGDDYVDWFGASVFTTGKIAGATRFLQLAREHKKPFMIAESTPQGSRLVPTKADWFKHIFRFIAEQKVEAFCYIDSNWEAMPLYKGQGWGDQRIEKEPQIKEMWLKEINQDRYLKASTDLFASLGWETSPENSERTTPINNEKIP